MTDTTLTSTGLAPRRTEAGAPSATLDDERTSGLGRRSFLRRTALLGATALVAADAAVAYRAYDQGVMAEGTGSAFDAWTSWQDGAGTEALVRAAVLAANGHNTQPWRFDVVDDRIDVSADISRSTGANDAADRELYVSLGCAIENMMIAAPANGLQAELRLMPPAAASDAVASIALRTGMRMRSPLHAVIGERHSNRSEYRADPIAPSMLAQLSELVDASVSPARLVWLDDAPSRARFGELIVDATVAHIADDEQSTASFAWWRSSWNEIQRHKDGLNIDGVGLPPLTRTLGKLLPAPSRASADRTFLERTRIQVGSAAAFGVVVVDDPMSRHDQLTGGRLLQRLHLSATTKSLGFQHMNQITERIDRDHQLGRTSPFSAPLEALVGPGALAAFRIGTPTVPSRRSPRRPANEVIR